MKKFDLMDRKPTLDILTLNYVWDLLWRHNHCNFQKNGKQRAKYEECERIMKLLEELTEYNIE